VPDDAEVAEWLGADVAEPASWDADDPRSTDVELADDDTEAAAWLVDAAAAEESAPEEPEEPEDPEEPDKPETAELTSVPDAVETDDGADGRSLSVRSPAPTRLAFRPLKS
jgi:hypothetical protein